MKRFLYGLLAMVAWGTGGVGRAQTNAAPAEPPVLETFYMFTIWDGIMSAPEESIREQMDRLVQQFGPGNRHNRIGFAFIMPGEKQLSLICRLAQEKGLKIGVILGTPTHTSAAFKPVTSADVRTMQWRANGKPANWRGYFTGDNDAGAQEIGEASRDHFVPSPSRYNTALRNLVRTGDRKRARALLSVMTEYPGVITVVNAVIEEELAIAAASLKTDDADGWLADYSPFAVTEFRDWLRHTGEYDADSGKYRGQGALEDITGPWVKIKGQMRSPFYDDETPDSARGDNPSFNKRFGTDFKTWELAYWDIVKWPDPITDQEINPMPTSGKGAVPGGFDAPRQRGGGRYWRAWSWDLMDQDKKQPPGHPDAPAWGFRQVLVAHWVRDSFDTLSSVGLPREMMYAHQIPGDTYGRRGLSSASTIWSGYLPKSGTVGITKFGRVEPKDVNCYAPRWGIFEWHPKPNSKADDPKLYEAALRDLRDYRAAGCHVLYAGWWRNDLKANSRDIFPMDDSKFADAIKDFLKDVPDEPLKK